MLPSGILPIYPLPDLPSGKKQWIFRGIPDYKIDVSNREFYHFVRSKWAKCRGYACNTFYIEAV